MEGSRDAITRAAPRAAEVAKQHGQPLLLWKDERMIEMMPGEVPSLPEKAPRVGGL